jgi:hypothetical protein
LPADIQPLESDTIKVPVRAISAHLIECYMIDMSNVDMLKSGVPMLKKAKVYTDHWVDTDTVVGKVVASEWADEGLPGINAVLSIDTVIAPMLARKVLSGLVDSVSIGFEFEWEQSHKDMPWETFFEMLGHEVDGELVRVIATKLIDIYEISFVWEGADPSAKINGYMHADEVEAQRQFANFEINPKMEDNMDELKELKKQYDKIEKEKLLLDDKVATLTDTVAQLQARADFGDEQINKMREETKKLAMLFRGGDSSVAFDKLIDNADLETLRMLRDDFESKVDQSMPLKCGDCGSTNVSRKSSVNSNSQVESAGVEINPNDYRG